MIKFTIYGRVQPQQRAGCDTRGKYPKFYEQKESKNYRTEIKNAAFVAVNGKWPVLADALNLEVKEFRKIPESWSAKKQKQAADGAIRPTSRPDLKNIIWIVEDALNALMYKDDSQIVSYNGSGKFYGDIPRIEITISKL